MPFIPHTSKDIIDMLSTIGCSDEADLFSDIPSHIPRCTLDSIVEGCSEQEISREMRVLAQKDMGHVNYIGAGAYEHYIPKAVWALTSRGEFYSSYTPYQAEASQGILQIFYEFQSYITQLTGMAVANCSLYDASTGLAEAILMVKRIKGITEKTKKPLRILSTALSPRVIDTLETLLKAHHYSLETLAQDSTGTVDLSTLEHKGKEAEALIISFPNYFGCLEEVHALTDKAHSLGLLVIALVNPLALSLFTSPGQWGKEGADIVIGDVQPFGIPLSSGGPYAGFIATKTIHTRQLPGRIVGRTLDRLGNPCFTLTLQAREQHIRREKSTSNICTNQGLLVIASSIHIALMGETGLRQVALSCHSRMQYFLEKALTIPGIRMKYATPFFHEVVLSFNQPVIHFLDRLLSQHNIIAGLPIGHERNTQDLLICITETKTIADLDHFYWAIKTSMEGMQ